MSRRTLILPAIVMYLCLPPLFAPAQCPDSAELNITATLYTQENGLASNMLYEIAKDSTGYIYFLGVDGKWIRYDGVNFSASNSYRDIPFIHYGFMGGAANNYTQQFIGNIHYKYAKNRNGTAYKWGLSADTLIWMDINKNKKETFLLPKDFREYHPTNFFPNGDVCWVTTPDKVFRFDILTKKVFPSPLPAVPEIESGKGEALFIFFLPGGASYLVLQNMILKLDSDSISFKKFCTFFPRPCAAHLPEIIMGRYLFLTESNNLFEIDLENGAAKTINLGNYTSIKNAAALKITTLRNYHDYLLIGTSNAGLFIFSRCTNLLQPFHYEKQTSHTNLTNSVIWVAVKDENVVWMETDAGLIKMEINDQRMKTYEPSSIKTGGVCNDCNNVRTIYKRDHNNLLIGSLGGVYNFNLNSGKFSDLISPADKKPIWNDRPVSAIAGDGKDNIFIADWSNKGILLFNREKKKLVNILKTDDHPEFAYNYMRCLFYDSHHVLWAGTTEGILRITNLDEFEKNDFKGTVNVSDQLPGKGSRFFRRTGQCFTITEDSNKNIWIGAIDGLYIYNYKTDSVIKYVHVPGNAKSLSDNEVRSIYISRDNDVWIGTNNGGLNHFDISTKTFTAFTTENGLPNNSIYTILGDNNGFLWLGTNAGLCRFNKADHSMRNYTPRDGIQNSEFNTNAVAVTTDGRFCFGGRTGFNIFHPDSMNITLSPPQVVITRFKIFDKEFPVKNSVLYLAHDQNSFTFDFAALNYYRSSNNQYAYMMEGADKDWIKSGNRQFTSYTNLPPGNYTFKVRAANYTGVWNEEITSMKFIINPAWYNTSWFRLVIIFLIAAGIYALYKYRVRQMLKLHAVRNRIASDLHDEIGSTLSSISLSSTIIQSKLNGNDTEVNKLLQQVSSNTDNMMEALSDIVWAINTRNDRFDNVVNRMRAFAIELLEPSNISIQFNVSDDILNIQLDMQQRKNLYLIFKEAVNNIVKYAGCKNVYIAVSRQGSRTFVMDIKDDGKGFEIAVQSGDRKSLSGNGIRNMKKRAEELGGAMIVKSARGEGTTLNFTFTV